jgi:hypothetical protein
MNTHETDAGVMVMVTVLGSGIIKRPLHLYNTFQGHYHFGGVFIENYVQYVGPPLVHVPARTYARFLTSNPRTVTAAPPRATFIHPVHDHSPCTEAPSALVFHRSWIGPAELSSSRR